MHVADKNFVLDLSQQPWPKLYQAAEFAFQEERWLAADRLLVEVLKQEPTHASAFHLLGKVYSKQARLSAALKAQQRSCKLDASLGWNWFAAGELLMELNRYDEALLNFEQAIATLPSEVWIREQIKAAKIARFFACTSGEELKEGIGPKTYGYWIQHHESPLPSASVSPLDDYWCLDPQNLELKRIYPQCSNDQLKSLKAPLGDSPWPTDGWLVLLGDGAQLRSGALQEIESWLIRNQDPQCSTQICHPLWPSIKERFQLPDLVYSDEDCLDIEGQRCSPWFKSGWVEESFWSSPWLMNLSVWRMSWLRDRQLPLPPTDLTGRWTWLLRALELNLGFLICLRFWCTVKPCSSIPSLCRSFWNVRGKPFERYGLTHRCRGVSRCNGNFLNNGAARSLSQRAIVRICLNDASKQFGPLQQTPARMDAIWKFWSWITVHVSLKHMRI